MRFDIYNIKYYSIQVTIAYYVTAILQNNIVRNRVIKFDLSLTEYDITYIIQIYNIRIRDGKLLLFLNSHFYFFN